jgi:hypothetical protein
MPKFLVSMNVVEARSTKFIIEAEDEDAIWDGIGNIDLDILEENLEWHTSEYEPPEIDEIKTIPNKSKDYTINKKIQKEFDKSIKELSE